MSVPIVVGTIPSLPMKGVSMLLGNKLVGRKVTMPHKIVLELVTSTEIEKILGYFLHML